MKVVKLGEVFEFQNGRAFKKSEWKESGIPIIRIQNLNSENAGFNYFTGDYDERIIVNSGDLLFSWSGTVGTSFGPHIWKGPQALLNQHIFKVQTSESIDPQYAYLSLLNITKEIENNVSGAVGLVHIKKSKLIEFLIPLPSLNAQKVTVEKLDKAFAEIDSLEKNLQLKDEKTNQLFQSVLSASFTNSETFDIKLVKLGDVAEVISGQSPEGIFYNKAGEGVPFYQGKKDFGARYIKEPVNWTTQITKIAKADDILMSVRAPVGPINLATQDICIGRGLAAIRVSHKILTEYLFYFLEFIQPSISGTSGAVFDSINKEQISAIQIPLQSIVNQKQIVGKLDKAFAEIDKIKIIISIEKERVSSLRQSILSNAFSFEEKVA